MNTLSLRRAALTSLIAGVVAGTIDVGCAALINRAAPGQILQVIAIGLFGRAAFHADGSAALGLLLQWSMSIIIAAIYLASARFRVVMLRHWVAAGLLYGTVVYVVMNFVVVPLSAMPLHGRITALGIALNLAAMWLFALIISYSAELAARRMA